MREEVEENLGTRITRILFGFLLRWCVWNGNSYVFTLIVMVRHGFTWFLEKFLDGCGCRAVFIRTYGDNSYYGDDMFRHQEQGTERCAYNQVFQNTPAAHQRYTGDTPIWGGKFFLEVFGTARRNSIGRLACIR